MDQGCGAVFCKVDLHVHTPGSNDAQASNKYGFSYEKRKGEVGIDREVREIAGKIVEACARENLLLIAVTDHNSPGYLDRFDIGSKTWYTLIRRAVKESFLDKEVISSYLVPRLRDLKANQQLITVTSNPDMVILGDSENVIVTKPGKQLKIVENGDIYKESIRPNVLDILEGGEESVIRRGGKLNVFEA